MAAVAEQRRLLLGLDGWGVMTKHWETDDAMRLRLLTIGCMPEEVCAELNIPGQSMSYWLSENGQGHRTRVGYH